MRGFPVTIRKWGGKLDKDLFITWMEKGMIHIPVVLLEKYKQLGLNEKEFILLLHLISFIEKGNDFPTPEQICNKMNDISSLECSQMIGKLVQREIIRIEESHSADHVRYEKYSLKPLWNKLAQEMISDQRKKDLETALLQEQDLYTIFEKEFGRPLSPMECESLAMWIDEDGQTPEIIKAALREAVLSEKLNFRYIDRILFDWKRNGINTIEKAKVHSLKFRKQTKNHVQSNGETSKTIPFYNWLEK